jgi:hypothetical protein
MHETTDQQTGKHPGSTPTLRPLDTRKYQHPQHPHPNKEARGDQMNTTHAHQEAANTGRRAMKLGLMLTHYNDPDVGQLIAECLRIGVPASQVIR